MGVILLRDFNSLLKAVQRAAQDAVNASKPTAVVYGKVISISPLKINVEQKMTLTIAQLVLTRNVTDFETELKLDGQSSKQKYIIHNALKVGDEVLMIQMQGGQKYIVMDRVMT